MGYKFHFTKRKIAMATATANIAYQSGRGPNETASLLPQSGDDDSKIQLFGERVVRFKFCAALALTLCFVIPSMGILTVTTTNGINIGHIIWIIVLFYILKYIWLSYFQYASMLPIYLQLKSIDGQTHVWYLMIPQRRSYGVCCSLGCSNICYFEDFKFGSFILPWGLTLKPWPYIENRICDIGDYSQCQLNTKSNGFSSILIQTSNNVNVETPEGPIQHFQEIASKLSEMKRKYQSVSCENTIVAVAAVVS